MTLEERGALDALSSRSLYELRTEMRDRMLASMADARDAVLAGGNVRLPGGEINRIIAECVDRALATDSPLQRLFWLDSLADVLQPREEPERKTLFLAACRRIEATFAVSPRERHDAVRVLANRVVLIP